MRIRSNNLVLFFLGLTVLSLYACKSDSLTPEPVHLRKVLLEEFAGFRCGLCPSAAELVRELSQNVYPAQVIPVSIHAGFLAQPLAPGAGQFETDLRTEEGDSLARLFNPQDLVPVALINRTENGNGGFVYGRGDWRKVLGELLESPPEAKLEIIASQHAAVLQIRVGLEFFTATPSDMRIGLYLLEDEVQTWQIDADSTPSEVEGYLQHSVLRAVPSGVEGKRLGKVQIQKGEQCSLEFEQALTPGWNPEKLRLVAFLYDFGSKEVWQAEELTGW